MNVYEKLANVQSALKAPKSQYNSFGKYHYRSCEDIVESVKPLLKENGLVLTMSDEIEMVANRIYVKATVEVVDTADGTSISVSAYAREEESKKGMDGSQVTGTSSSYARKYALNGLFAIDDKKEADATNNHGKEEPKKEDAKKAEPKKEKKVDYRSLLIARLKELNMDNEKFAKENNLNKETSPEEFRRLLWELDNK